VETILSADATPTGIVENIYGNNFMFGKKSALQEEKACIRYNIGTFLTPSE